MGDDEGKPRVRVKKLEYSISSYVKWVEEMGQEILMNVKLQTVGSHAINGQDWVLENIQAITDEKEKRDKIDKFETAGGAFIAHCLSAMSTPVRDRMMRDEEFETIVVENDAREFWGMIRDTILTLNGDGQQLRRSRQYLDKFDKTQVRILTLMREDLA